MDPIQETITISFFYVKIRDTDNTNILKQII